jgi:RNA polymerase sigma-70 factor (ECF subfamily)
VRQQAITRLHTFLLRAARAETQRRAHLIGVAGPELTDIAQQATDDALVSILAKVNDFRGESAFTTWAYKFVIFEVASKISRHHWQRRTVALDTDEWERLPSRLGAQPDEHAQWAELVVSVRGAMEKELTDKQRRVFVSLVVEGVPLDVLAAETGSTRGAIYKLMFDARRKIHAALVADGQLDHPTVPRLSAVRPQPGDDDHVSTWPALDRLLATDPIDAGCDTARDLLDVYAEGLLADRDAAQRRFPQIAAHLRACGPCAEDLEGLLHALDARA